MAIHLMRIDSVGYALTFATRVVLSELECKTSQRVDLLACIVHGIRAGAPETKVAGGAPIETR